jgi:hypothetical protein
LSNNSTLFFFKICARIRHQSVNFNAIQIV